MKNPKILVPDIADRASFALDEKGDYAITSGYAITIQKEAKESPKYFLALLNSRLLDFYLKRISTTMRDGFFRYFTKFIEQLPIRRIDFSKLEDKALYDNIVNQVDQIISFYKRLPNIKTPHEKELLDRQIQSVTQEIDQLVYQLYGLTDEEIKIVEGAK